MIAVQEILGLAALLLAGAGAGSKRRAHRLFPLVIAICAAMLVLTILAHQMFAAGQFSVFLVLGIFLIVWDRRKRK